MQDSCPGAPYITSANFAKGSPVGAGGQIGSRGQIFRDFSQILKIVKDFSQVQKIVQNLSTGLLGRFFMIFWISEKAFTIFGIGEKSQEI